jgi:Bacterial Ig-like domain
MIESAGPDIPDILCHEPDGCCGPSPCGVKLDDFICAVRALLPEGQIYNNTLSPASTAVVLPARSLTVGCAVVGCEQLIFGSCCEDLISCDDSPQAPQIAVVDAYAAVAFSVIQALCAMLKELDPCTAEQTIKRWALRFGIGKPDPCGEAWPDNVLALLICLMLQMRHNVMNWAYIEMLAGLFGAQLTLRYAGAFTCDEEEDVHYWWSMARDQRICAEQHICHDWIEYRPEDCPKPDYCPPPPAPQFNGLSATCHGSLPSFNVIFEPVERVLPPNCNLPKQPATLPHDPQLYEVFKWLLPQILPPAFWCFYEGEPDAGCYAPVITMVTVGADSVIASGSATNDQTPTLFGTAPPDQLVTVFDGQLPIGTVQSDANGAWEFTPAALGAGTRSFTATAIDAADNESAASNVYVVIIDIEADVPIIVSVTDNVGPTVGVIADGGACNDLTPTLDGSAEAGSTVTIYDGPTQIAVVTATAGGTWTFTPAAPLAGGAHSFTATSTDALGNVSDPSTAYDVTITVPPSWVDAAYGSLTADPVFVVHFNQNQSWIIDSVSAPAMAPFTVARAGVGYAEDTAGAWSQFAANVARRTDKGLLIEEARTNAIRNNSMQGALAGDPGTVPTNWTISDAVAGLERTIVGTLTQNGIDYIDVRFAGTISGGTVSVIDFEPGVGGIAAAQNDVRTISAFIALVGGTITSTGIAAIDLRHRTLIAGGGGLNNFIGPNIRDQLTGTMQRFSFTATYTDATTALVIPRIAITPNVVSTVVNFTLRIGWPQLELGPFVTSPIRTTTAAVARAADVISMPIGSWFNEPEGTLFADLQLGGDLSAASPYRLHNAGATDMHYGRIAGDGTWQSVTLVGGVVQTNMGGMALSANARYKFAHTYKLNDHALSVNGGAASLDASGTVPSGLTTLRFSDHTSTAQFGGYLRRFAYFRERLPNADLQAMTVIVQLDLNFTTNTGSMQEAPLPSSTAPLVVTRASTGYAENIAGVWTSFAANTARRTNKGLLIEEARTNSVRNSSMQGASAGLGAWQDAVNLTLATASAGWSGFNLRQMFQASTLSIASGSKIRLTLQSGQTQAVQIINCYVGHRAAGGDGYDFAGDQVQLTVGGASNFTIPTNTTVVTDEINFAFDGSKGLVVSAYIGAPPDVIAGGVADLGSGYGTWYFSGANQASMTDVSGYISYGLRSYLVQRVEVFAPTPGTFPTNWDVITTIPGAVLTCVGVGAEDGLDYIDIRLVGTVPSGNPYLYVTWEPNGLAASAGQVWTHSYFWKLIAGTFNPSWSASYIEWYNVTTFLGQVETEISPTPAKTRLVQTGTAPATTNNTLADWYAEFGAGSHDFTLRFYAPQQELGAFATSPIRTTTVAVTRAADQVTIGSFGAWFNATEGTLFCEASPYTYAVANPAAGFQIDDGTTQNRHFAGFTGVTQPSTTVAGTLSANAIQASINRASVAGINKCALGYKVNDFAMSFNGEAAQLDTSGALPVALSIGRLGGLANTWNGYIRRATYYPTKLSSAQISALTAASPET